MKFIATQSFLLWNIFMLPTPFKNALAIFDFKNMSSDKNWALWHDKFRKVSEKFFCVSQNFACIAKLGF